MNANRQFFDLCYLDGSMDGVVRCEFGPSQYVVYRIPASRFEELRKSRSRREDPILAPLEYKGIYFLLTYDDRGGIKSVYVGQAGGRSDERLGILNRIYEHERDKYKGWTVAVALTTVGNRWEPTELSYLENRFYSHFSDLLGEDACANSTTPSGARPTHQQSYALDLLMENSMVKCFNLLGLTFSKARVGSCHSKKSTNRSINSSSATSHEDDPGLREYECHSARASAKGIFTKKRTTKGFTVLKGSRISLKPVDCFIKESAYKVWQKLMDDGVVGKDGVLTVDYEFTSPSAASAVVQARPSNGWYDWKHNGKTLEQMEGDS